MTQPSLFQVQTTLRFSEAIRLGAMLRPQAVFKWFDKSGGSCALGAALEAIGIANSPDDNNGLVLKVRGQSVVPEAWRWIATTIKPCPVCARMEQVQRHVRHLNNDHRWAREDIADWVETVETQAVAETPELVSAIHS